MNFKPVLSKREIEASVPCRIDFGGTLDISTFYLPLNKVNPSTFNIALDLRTQVTFHPWKENEIKITSKGFETAVFKKGEAPFNHPMGLMFAVIDYFNAHGLHVHIESNSPPRSALGGSSSAAVAILSGFYHLMDDRLDPEHIVWLAHYIEGSVAGVPCGVQDQLAAAYGGVHQWKWKMGRTCPSYERVQIFESGSEILDFNRNILVAYCGIPHVSKDINKQWVNGFIESKNRSSFEKIAELTNKFSMAVKSGKFGLAADLMNQETQIRLAMTPDVLDNTGKKLFEKAGQFNCGARFSGAGGGGCLWAIGDKSDIDQVRNEWQDILSPIDGALILDTKIDQNGIIVV